MKYATASFVLGIAVTLPFVAGAFAWSSFSSDTIGTAGSSAVINRFADRDNPNVICYVAQVDLQANPSISCVNLGKAPATYR